MIMKTSTTGIQMIMQLEGAIPDVYRDAVGLPTIGVGHLLSQDEISSGKIELSDGAVLDIRQPLSYSDMHRLLMDDLTSREAAVVAAINVPLMQNQFDALVSFCFNVGNRAFTRSTLVKKINAGEWENIPEQFRRWNKAGGRVIEGLVNRRETEIAMFQGQIISNKQQQRSIYVKDNHGDVLPVINYDAPQTKPKVASKIVWTQLLSVAFALFAAFGLTVPPELQQMVTELVAGTATVSGIITIVFRLYFTRKLLH